MRRPFPPSRSRAASHRSGRASGGVLCPACPRGQQRTSPRRHRAPDRCPNARRPPPAPRCRSYFGRSVPALFQSMPDLDDGCRSLRCRPSPTGRRTRPSAALRPFRDRCTASRRWPNANPSVGVDPDATVVGPTMLQRRGHGRRQGAQPSAPVDAVGSRMPAIPHMPGQPSLRLRCDEPRWASRGHVKRGPLILTVPANHRSDGTRQARFDTPTSDHAENRDTSSASASSPTVRP